MEHFQRHVRIGGYPQAWLNDTPHAILTELVNAFIIRDASDLFKIAKPEAFRRLLRLVAGQIAQLVNYAEWASILGISRDTVASYLNILAEGHVIHTLSPFAGGKRSELTGRPKLYFVDNGIRNHQAGELGPIDELSNIGPMLENWVLTELIKTLPSEDSLHFWRSTSGTEVDFVINRRDHLIAIEVKAQAMTKPRLPRACRSFIDAYQPQRLLIINRSLNHSEQIGQTKVIWTPPHQFLELTLNHDL